VSSDYLVTARSDDEVKDLAKKVRASFAIVREGRVDLIASLQQKTIWTVFGTKEIKFQVCGNAEFPNTEGVTEYGPGTVTINLKRSEFHRLRVGEGRAANTVAHELGHAVMHDGPPMYRRAFVGPKISWIPAYRSAEHQAKVFAPAFLIDDQIADALSDPEEISVTFGISYESATIWVRQRQQERRKPQIVEGLRQIASELNLNEATDKPSMTY
jgi:hypothetical protein